MVRNRRDRARFKTDISVRVTLLDEPALICKGRLANLSAHGLSIILSDELNPGSIVRVEWGDTDFVGEVIYCRMQGQEFLAGLKVEGPVYDAKSPQTGKRVI